MIVVFNKIESLIRVIIIKIKLIYYKAKYGSRLKIGKRIRFRKGFSLHISKDAKVEIGDNVFFNRRCTIDALKEISIGNHNLFGEDVKIYDHNHVFNNKNINRGNNFSSRPVIIGENNWIGSNVVILKKAKIGNNNVIGANTNISFEIDNDSIVKVNECKYVVEKIKYND